MTRVLLECITMSGNQYVLWRREDGLRFPSGELPEGAQPSEAVRALVREWSNTQQPKLELVDLFTGEAGDVDELVLLFRALLTSEPEGDLERVARGELEAKGALGRLTGKQVEEALKTSLNYKLTRG